MPAQENTLARKRGRPATGRGQTVGVRILPDLMDAMDAAIAADGVRVTRPEMIRRIVADWLRERGFVPQPKPASITSEELDATNDG